MIRKNLAFFALIALLVLTACSGGGGNGNVEITIPASYFMGDPDQAIEEAKSRGITEATVNEDGSVTYTMTKATHDKIMKEMKDEMEKVVKDLTSGDELSSIKDIEYNDDFTEFTMIVDREAYENSFDGFAILGLGLQGAIYQTFDGVASDDIQVTINLQDEATGEVFDTAVFPDQMQE